MAVLETSPINNQPGVYKHPETGAEVVARSHPKFGSAMADGFVTAGFVFDRPEDAKSSDRESASKKATTKGNN